MKIIRDCTHCQAWFEVFHGLINSRLTEHYCRVSGARMGTRVRTERQRFCFSPLTERIFSHAEYLNGLPSIWARRVAEVAVQRRIGTMNRLALGFGKQRPRVN